MAYLDWKEELNTGISVIDGQHRRIVSYINQLAEVSASGEVADVTDIITALIDYTISHFAFEESLLEDAGYTVLAEHKHKHDDFRNKIYAFKQRAGNGEDVARELLELLHDWLLGHILSEDGQYVPAVSAYLDKLEADQNSGWLKTKIKGFFN